jgi:hypothetical protein
MRWKNLAHFFSSPVDIYITSLYISVVSNSLHFIGENIMKITRVTLTVLVREDEVDEFFQDFADFRNGAELAIWFDELTQTPVDVSELEDEQKELFSYGEEDGTEY